MFSSLLGSRRAQKSRAPERTPLLDALRKYQARRPDDDGSASEAEEDVAQYDGEDEDEDNVFGRRDGPLLPVFSEFLDRLPIYTTTHAIRLLVVQRCETTLSWDQLRSPQISSFLVKPIQQQLLADHFSRGTIYCLLANCLQFRREGDENPGMVGISRTRALICELLAMRLLKDFSTRELIDALSYDFDPLQGMAMPALVGTTTPGGSWVRQSQRSARISAMEVAIRASAKKFLAHPLVVQQLEAIWAGSIVFHSQADNLHRTSTPRNSPPRFAIYDDNVSPGRGPSRQFSPRKQGRSSPPQAVPNSRRTVTLYDPHDASLFKLSRLRVPRYRSLFSTLSFAVMLGLFVAVLMQKSDDITALEVLFWFWSAGYMLDEIVGWSEQGFGLYIMSFWNGLDLGILFCLLVYYVLRLYGILIEDTQRPYMASLAYDVLGATAVLLFPRLFSALDHYRYFSQLLIAFRMMAMDLAAILILILISCSGFFVAFTLAFKRDFGASNVAYILFQMVMGFTPAAWDHWDIFSPLGKGLLAVFLIICHFLIVTILITVLTNSFMAVVQNANEEHQFLFAVNTISMVKSDALFSYIAPMNIFGWLLIPLKFCMPFKRFIRMNRLIIKITHIPILFSIFVYERLLLSTRAYEPTALVEERGRSQTKRAGPAFSIRGGNDLFSPGARLREPSITTFRKDRALEEVFRRPYRDPTPRSSANPVPPRRKSSNIVSDWMRGMRNDGEPFSPQDDSRSFLERVETRRDGRPPFRRTRTSGYIHQRRHRHPLGVQRTVASDPDELLDLERPIAEEEEPNIPEIDLPNQTDADGDDELVTNSESARSARGARKESDDSGSDKENIRPHPHPHPQPHNAYETSEDDLEFFRTPMTTTLRERQQSQALASSPTSTGYAGQTPVQNDYSRDGKKPRHARNWSSNTVLFSPAKPKDADGEYEETNRSSSPPRRLQTGMATGLRSGKATPGGGRIPKPTTADGNGRRTTPKAFQPFPPFPSSTSHGPSSGAGTGSGATARPRPVLSVADKENGSGFRRSTPNIAALLALNNQMTGAGSRRTPSFTTMANALDLASDLGDNRGVPDFAHFGGLGGLPASFTTQFELGMRGNAKTGSGAMKGSRMQGWRGKGSRDENDELDDDDDGEEDTDSRRVSRIMLARMATLEEGFRDVLREVKGLSLRNEDAYSPTHRLSPAHPGMASRDVSSSNLKAKSRAKSIGGHVSPILTLSNKREKEREREKNGKGKKREKERERRGSGNSPAGGAMKGLSLGAPFPSLSEGDDGNSKGEAGAVGPRMGSSA